MFPVVILAGGLASRMRLATKTLPKSLLPVNGESLVTHQLRLLKQNGIAKVVFCVGYLNEMLEDYVGKGSMFGLHTRWS
jgi:NDP-sugar pyrophosphorylase family protein